VVNGLKRATNSGAGVEYTGLTSGRFGEKGDVVPVMTRLPVTACGSGASTSMSVMEQLSSPK
jgi:hypothetical protein